MVAELISSSVNDTISHFFQAGYTSMKKEIKAPIFQFVKKSLIEVVQQNRLDSLLVLNHDKLTETAWIMDAFAHGMVGSITTKKPVQQFENFHVEKVNDKCCLERIIERQARNKRLVHAKEDGEISKLPTRPPSELKSCNERKSHRKQKSSSHAKKSEEVDQSHLAKEANCIGDLEMMLQPKSLVRNWLAQDTWEAETRSSHWKTSQRAVAIWNATTMKTKTSRHSVL